MKNKIFITRKIDKKGLEILNKHKDFEIEINNSDKTLSKSELIKKAKDASALITLLTDEVDEEVIKGVGDQLKIIANYAVGFDNIDLDAASKNGIIVTNTPEVMTQAVAEHAVALMLCCSRRICEGDKYVRAGKYKVWEPELLLGPEIAGKNLGIIGIGRIGEALAQIAYHGFGMKVYYNDLSKNEEIERTLQADFLQLDQLLKKSDFISVHVPLNKATHHLIGKKEIGMMKKNAILVNTARGAVVDEKELIKALKDKKIYAAGIDVFEEEGNPSKEFYKLDNVVLTPHIASATHEARQSMAENVAKNVIAVLEGDQPLTPVNIKE